jgi:hypothetical protein
MATPRLSFAPRRSSGSYRQRFVSTAPFPMSGGGRVDVVSTVKSNGPHPPVWSGLNFPNIEPHRQRVAFTSREAPHGMFLTGQQPDQTKRFKRFGVH